MARVILLRHGQTDHNKQEIMQGLLDVPLNEEGERQAQAVAAWLKSRFKIDEVFSSHLARAHQTAGPIAKLQGCTHITDETLCEIDVGDWQGLSYTEARENYPKVWDKLMTDPYNTKRPNGESFADLYNRTVGWFTEHIEQARPDGTYCIVTHGAPLRALLAHALSVHPTSFGLRLSIDNTGVSIMEYEHKWQRWQIHSINTTCHLH